MAAQVYFNPDNFYLALMKLAERFLIEELEAYKKERYNLALSPTEWEEIKNRVWERVKLTLKH